MKSCYYLLVLLIFLSYTSFSEGTKNVMPNNSNGTALHFAKGINTCLEPYFYI